MRRTSIPLLSPLCLSLLAGCSGSSFNPDSNAPLIAPPSEVTQTARAGQPLSFEVTARDPHGSALSFSWSATLGTLGTPSSDGSSSHVTWTAPLCAAVGTLPTITVAVTNASQQTTTQGFSVPGLPFCSAWSKVSTPNLDHTFAQSVLLPDGRVFCTAGVGELNGLDAEVYDPVTDQWSYPGPPGEKHRGETPTLLPDGTVLVTGWGYGPTQVDPVIYNPTTNTWHPAGAMVTPRPNGYTATLLPNGKVLVAGGIVESPEYGFTRTGLAELYDPATGTWSSTGSMSHNREGHAAVLLPNGKVLVIGGVSGDRSLKTEDSDLETPKTSELYDPATGTWSLTGALAKDRAFDTPTALLLGGKVFVAGSDTDSTSLLTTDELYDPATGLWSAVGPPHEKWDDPMTTVLDNGQVLVAGGMCKDGSCKNSRLYDPATSTWRESERMVYANHFGATGVRLLTGQVLVVGGLGGLGGKSAELYTP